MIPPSGARDDSGDGLTGEATGTEQPPSPASTSSLESKVRCVRLPWGNTESPLPLSPFLWGPMPRDLGRIPRELGLAGPIASHAKPAAQTQTFAVPLP